MTVGLTREQKIWKTRRANGNDRMSEETRRKVSEAMTGRTQPEEVKRKLREMTLTMHRDKAFKEKWIGSLLRGPDNPAWNGGQTLVKGYVYVSRPDHPNATQHGYVKRSRLAMEEHIGRYLTAEEVVHHEGEKTDDRVEMLILFPSQSDHAAHHGFGTLTRGRR